MSHRRITLFASAAALSALAPASPVHAQLLTIEDIADQITVLDAQVTLHGQAILNNSNAIVAIGADISVLNTNVTQIQTDITANNALDATQSAQITAIDGRVTVVEAQSSINTTAIAALDVRVGANDAVDVVQSTQITAIDGRVTVVENQTGTNTGAIATLNGRLNINDLRDVAQDVTLADHTLRLDDHDNQLAAHDARLAANDAVDAAQTGQIVAIDGRVTVLESQTGANAGAIATLGARLNINDLRDTAQDAVLVDHEQRLDGHDGQLATLDARLTLNDGRDDAQDARLDGHDSQLASLDGRIVANDLRDDGQDARLNNHDGQLASHETRLIANDVRDDGQDARLDGYGQRLDGHDTQLASHDQRLTVNDARDDTQALLLVEHDARIWTAQGTADAAAVDAANLRSAVVAGQIGLVQQASYSAPVTVAAATGGDLVSFAGQAGDRRLSGVASGVNANDAVNLSQMQLADTAILNQARSYTDSSIAGLSFDLGRLSELMQYNDRELRQEIEAASAGAAALAGLPQAFQPGKGMVAIGMGGRGSNTAFAIGVGKAFNSPNTPVLRAGAAIDARRGDVTYNAAVGFHF